MVIDKGYLDCILFLKRSNAILIRISYIKITKKTLSWNIVYHKGNNQITEHRAIFQRERQNSYFNKQTKSVNNRKTGKTAMSMALTWYKHFAQNEFVDCHKE